MLSLRHVDAGYSAEQVLAGISVEIAAGEFVGLIGPNGSGKTTLLHVISGTLAPRQGSVWLGGRPLRAMRRREVARVLAHLMQDPPTGLAFSVRELVLMGRVPHLPRFGRESPQDLAIAQAAMQRAQVAHLADRLVAHLSGGERQRVGLAMCLAQEPEVLLLDEPTSHLDLGQQLSILDLIRDINRQRRTTVVAVFHDLNLAAEYSDRLLLLQQGQLAAAGRPEEVLTAERIAAAFGARVLVQPHPVSGRPHVISVEPSRTIATEASPGRTPATG